MTNSQLESGAPVRDLEASAKEHLWLHYTTMSDFDQAPLPIIVGGDGCYVECSDGKRRLDGLSGLFCVNIGYGYGDEIGEAASAQLRQLPYASSWSHSHPRTIELAETLAELTPGTLNRSFFCSGGSEAVESAWKLARQHHFERGERRWKVVSRDFAWHGSSFGALSITGMSVARTPFEPLVPDVVRVSNTNRFRHPQGEDEAAFSAMLVGEMRDAILRAGPETVAMVLLEPVQNLGGAFTPPAGYFEGVRTICDEFGILLCADEVICGFGRLGRWFGSDRYEIRPDLITCAKGLSSGYAPIGAVVSTPDVADPLLQSGGSFSHGFTFGGNPLSAAVALKNLEVMRRDRIVENVAANEAAFTAALEQLRDLPLVGDIRGCGYFRAVELVSDPETKAGFSDDEAEQVIWRFISRQLFERGLICRADDRADPVIQLCPPLVAGAEEFDRIAEIVGGVLEEAWEVLGKKR